MEVLLHPSFDISEAGGEGAMGGCRDGVGGEVDLSVISVTVKMEAMLAEDLTEWEDVDITSILLLKLLNVIQLLC